MAYRKATDILPPGLLASVQEFVDGEYLYIPRKDENRKEWGEATDSRERLADRNRAITRAYQDGMAVPDIADRYYLSPKTVYKIVAARRNAA